jgi:hypothetical protein
MSQFARKVSDAAGDDSGRRFYGKNGKDTPCQLRVPKHAGCVSIQR